MAEEQLHRSDAFVVRIWWEQENGKCLWRGRVQHASTGQARYFRCVTDLLAFIETHTGSLHNQPYTTGGKK